MGGLPTFTLWLRHSSRSSIRPRVMPEYRRLSVARSNTWTVQHCHALLPKGECGRISLLGRQNVLSGFLDLATPRVHQLLTLEARWSNHSICLGRPTSPICKTNMLLQRLICPATTISAIYPNKLKRPMKIQFGKYRSRTLIIAEVCSAIIDVSPLKNGVAHSGDWKPPRPTHDAPASLQNPLPDMCAR